MRAKGVYWLGFLGTPYAGSSDGLRRAQVRRRRVIVAERWVISGETGPTVGLSPSVCQPGALETRDLIDESIVPGGGRHRLNPRYNVPVECDSEMGGGRAIWRVKAGFLSPSDVCQTRCRRRGRRPGMGREVRCEDDRSIPARFLSISSSPVVTR